MRVLVACERSGRVREAFRARGHDAWSCDLAGCEDGSRYHHKGDVFGIWQDGWDVMIAHPPCTHLAVSGSRYFAAKQADGRQADAIAFVRRLMEFRGAWAIENPVAIISSHIRKPDQIIQPWQYGHGETKATCLWLHKLPVLRPTCIVEGREGRIWKMPPGPMRAIERSRTYRGVADAMAEQWSDPARWQPEAQQLELL